MLVVLYNVALVCIATYAGFRVLDTLAAMRSGYIDYEDYMTTHDGTIPHVSQSCIRCRQRFDLTERAAKQEAMPREQRKVHGYCDCCQPASKKEPVHDA